MVEVLRAHKTRQNRERLALGETYGDSRLEVSDLVFAQGDGKAIHPDCITKVLPDPAKAAKLPVIRVHDLRHSFGTGLHAADVDLKTISGLLGRSSVGITGDLYVHRVSARDRETVGRLASVR